MKVLVKDRSPVVQGVVVEAPREWWQVVTSARDLLIGAPVTWAAFQIIAYDEHRRHGLSVAVMEMKRKARGAEDRGDGKRYHCPCVSGRTGLHTYENCSET